ncbi:MAG: hypothetical protein JKY94_00570 [Rhodobacteraceae bacterium]|nr:hypothetical protein [Paracoccaceae bacterium]
MPQDTSPKKSGELSPHAQYIIERHGVIWLVWFLLCVLGWMKTGPELMRGKLQGNDDYLRLVQIRDWLGGQPWSDLHQYRLNPVDPIIMHWSRISDVLIGVPIKLLTPIIGVNAAEIFMMAAYPSLMLLGFLYLVVALTLTLTKDTRAPMAAVFMAALSYGVLAQFNMGRIDHHGLQIVMALGCLWCLIKSADTAKYAVYAGALCGLGLYVGIESAPYIAAACISVVLIWVFSEPHAGSRMRRFGMAMATTTLFSLLISAPPARWFVPSCDAISVVYTQLTLAVSLMLWGLSFASRRVTSPITRFVLAGGLGGLGLGLTLVLFPQCLQGPYAELDPRLTEIWLSNVSEAERFHKYFLNELVGGSAMIILPILTLIGFWVYHKKTGLALTLAPRSILIFMALACLAGLVQTRLMTFATSFAIPFCAYLLVYGLERAGTLKSTIVKNAARVGVLVVLAPVTIPLILVAFEDKQDAKADTVKAEQIAQCTSQAVLSKLDTLAPGTALTQIDMGAAILAHTRKLRVTSAPYHRNTHGILAAIDLFMGDEEMARQAVRRTEADYIIACAHNNEAKLYQNYAPDGLMAVLNTGTVPHWLEKLDVDPSGNLLVYRVKDRD